MALYLLCVFHFFFNGSSSCWVIKYLTPFHHDVAIPPNNFHIPPTGEGSGDDETILVDLAQVPSHIHHLAFTANIYSDGRTFAEVFDSYIRMLGPGGQILARYQLGEHVASRGLFFACFSRWTSSNWGEGWHFQAVGELVGGKRGSDAECREAVRSVLMTGRVPMPDPPVVPSIPAPPVVPEPNPDPGPDGEQMLSTDQTFNMHKGDSATVPQALAAGELRLGLGWTTQQQNLDLDASCLMLTQDYSCSAEWTVHFGQKSLPGVTHGGDNLNGTEHIVSSWGLGIWGVVESWWYYTKVFNCCQEQYSIAPIKIWFSRKKCSCSCSVLPSKKKSAASPFLILKKYSCLAFFFAAFIHVILIWWMALYLLAYFTASSMVRPVVG